MLVTQTATSGVDGTMTITLAAKANAITRILRVEGTRLGTTALTVMPLIQITNCQNTDGTAFTGIFQPEEEGGGTTPPVRQARCVVFDPPWRLTVMPSASAVISYRTGVADASGSRLIVGYKYE